MELYSAANVLKWTKQDLHALYQKRFDPSTCNCSTFVRHRTKSFSSKKAR